jgi:hypothetical protein
MSLLQNSYKCHPLFSVHITISGDIKSVFLHNRPLDSINNNINNNVKHGNKIGHVLVVYGLQESL